MKLVQLGLPDHSQGVGGAVQAHPALRHLSPTQTLAARRSQAGAPRRPGSRISGPCQTIRVEACPRKLISVSFRALALVDVTCRSRQAARERACREVMVRTGPKTFIGARALIRAARDVPCEWDAHWRRTAFVRSAAMGPVTTFAAPAHRRSEGERGNRIRKSNAKCAARGKRSIAARPSDLDPDCAVFAVEESHLVASVVIDERGSRPDALTAEETFPDRGAISSRSPAPRTPNPSVAR